MSNSLLYFIFLFLFSCATSSSSSIITHRCSVQQTNALLQFKHSLSSINFSVNIYEYSPCENWLGSGYSPLMMKWNKSTDCCDWNGVTCDHSTGDVISLDLSCGMLQGIIHPNSTLFHHFPRLQRLNLAYNALFGSQLPPDIDRLSSSLTHLNISNCWFSGHVPANISHLHKLVSLDLSWNEIDFSREPHVFISLLQNLTVMEELSLEYVNIISVLPANLNISSSLRLLNLGVTRLQGNIPRNIFNLRSLETLDLSSNSFTGYVPSDISHLTKLVSLDLSFNYNGMPDLLMQPHILSMLLHNSTTLSDLRLYGVSIGAFLPTYLNISAPLRSLVLSSTNLQGKLPDNILNLKYLETLYLSSNDNLSGPLPKVNTSTSIPLYNLDMSHTSLSGEIPSSIGHLTSLDYLDLSYCRLNGSIPKSIANLKHITILDLSSNMLNGSIPKFVANIKRFFFLDLSSNLLSGTLPSSLFTLSSLETVRLSNNQLTGQIDVFDDGRLLQTFQKLTNLTELDLSNNRFRGDWELDTLLSSLTNLKILMLSHSGVFVTTSKANHYVNHNIQMLRLASCSLKVFPLTLKSMKSLLHLDLSNNDIQGHIPNWTREIGKNEMVVFDLSNNSITGTIPNVYEDWSELQGFILNGNKLEGKVPTSLQNCQDLAVIDLGNNLLNDTFPSWLGDLPGLMALILRSNNFHGDIVTSSTVELLFQNLRVLDLSHNGFVGKLPTSFFQNLNAMKTVVKSDTKPDYVKMGNVYYSIKVAMKGMDRDLPRLLVDYMIIDLSDNKFKKEIPHVIGNLKALKGLKLSNNILTGRIPQALGNLSEIESLDLSLNQLSGEIPESLTKLTFLEFLNLSQNRLVGRIPHGKQFDTFDANSFTGNPKLCGFQLFKNCGDQHLHEQLEDDGDVDDEERGIIWEVVMIGFGCGTLLGFTLGYLMLYSKRSNWFNSIADATEHMLFKSQNKRRSIKLLNQTRHSRLRR